jgi:hypothetical protein
MLVSSRWVRWLRRNRNAAAACAGTTPSGGAFGLAWPGGDQHVDWGGVAGEQRVLRVVAVDRPGLRQVAEVGDLGVVIGEQRDSGGFDVAVPDHLAAKTSGAERV